MYIIYIHALKTLNTSYIQMYIEASVFEGKSKGHRESNGSKVKTLKIPFFSSLVGRRMPEIISSPELPSFCRDSVSMFSA